MVRLMIGRFGDVGAIRFLIAAGCLAASAVLVSAAAASGGLLVVLAVGLAVAAFAIAMVRPNLLLYAYCAAIPFNFALPPGPAGTVARIAGLIFVTGYLLRFPGSLRPSSISVAGWIFVAWCLATILWAVNASYAWSAWLSLAQLFLITVLIASIVAVDRDTVSGALWAYSIAATVTAAVAVMGYLGGSVLFSRATAFSEQDPALFSSIVLPAAVVLMGEIESPSTTPPLRLAVLGALGICIASLALSGTRSAWLGIIVAVAVFVIIRRNRRQLVGVAAILVGLLAVATSIPGALDFLGARAASSISSGGSGRTDIWAVGLSILATAPVVGVGFGNFGPAFTPYAIAHASASIVGGALTADRGAHNVLLGTTVETGLVGGLLLVLFVGGALVVAGNDRLGSIVRIALLSLVVQSAFLDILSQKQVWLFIALAYGLGMARQVASPRVAPEPPLAGGTEIPPPRPA
jgi:exopolysaccharide production protein ExoQ